MEKIIIGIAGTAKNTGKTTTTLTIMQEVKKAKLSLGLTSIGYDGEDLDNVTGLPKPKIEVWPGVVVAIAEKCLKISTAEVEILEATNLATPLGKVILGKVTKGGKLVIAGPNKSSELGEVLSKLSHHNLNIVIVDGALNRIAPMVEVDGLILTTGAARKNKISDLAFETHCIIDIFNYPIFRIEPETVRFSSILSNGQVKELLEKLNNTETVYIDGVIGEKSLVYLAEKGENLKGKKIILPDPIKLLVAGDINKIHDNLAKLKEKGVKLGVAKTIKPIAITINPYYPRYRFNSDDYEAHYVDREKLYQAIAQNISINIYDVVQEGGSELIKEILAASQRIEQ